MKVKAFKIINLILAVLVCVFALSHAFAWFTEDMREAEQKYDGSSGSPYFESGNGASNTPFIISNSYHMYNLAWLQNRGKLDDAKYYFKLKDNITIPENFWLPPIGTDRYPFKGVFNGNGKTITGLKVTTNKDDLTNLPSQDRSDFSQSVGMFGMTAQGAEIKNFNLINPVVVVDAKATYSSSSAKTVGVAIGYANCGASNIGVYNGKLKVELKDYTTVNSIVGGYDSEIVDGSGINGGSGADGGDTGQFIPDVFASNYSNLTNIMSSATSFNTGVWLLPKTDSDNGIGLGSFSMIVGGTTTIGNASVSKFTYYTTKTSDTIPTYNATGGTYSVDLSESNSNTEQAEAIRKKVLKGATQITSLSHLLYFKNSPDKVTSGLKAYYETNNAYSNSHSSTVQTNCIKVRVKKSTTKIFVIAESRSSSEQRYLGVYKVSDRVTDFDTRVNDSTYEERFVKDSPIMQLALPGGQIVACEFDLTGQDAGAGTYQLNSTKNGINFYYVSVTGTTDGDSGGEGGAIPTLEKIDFIYDDGSSNVVLINTATATNVIVKFTTAEITLLYFYRPANGKDENNNYTLCVDYNVEGSGTEPTFVTSVTGKSNITKQTGLTSETFLTYPSTS